MSDAELIATIQNSVEDIINQHERRMQEFFLTKVINVFRNIVTDAVRIFGRKRLSSREAAEYLGITVKALQKRVERGTIIYHRDKQGRLYFYRHEIDPQNESFLQDIRI